MDIGSIILSFVLTLVAYGLAPALVYFLRKKAIKRGTWLGIIIANGILIRLVFMTIQGKVGIVATNNTPAFMWGFIYYGLFKGLFIRKGLWIDKSEEHDEKTSTKVDAIPNRREEQLIYKSDKDEIPELAANSIAHSIPKADEYANTMSEKESSVKEKVPKRKYCSRCGSLIARDTKKCTGCGKQYFKGIKISAKGIIICILLLLLIGSGTLNVIQYSNSNNLEATLEATLEDVRLERNELQRKYRFVNDKYTRLSYYVDNKIAFVADDGTNLYHKYDCELFQNCDSYWIYNIEAAKSRGYNKCPLCH